MTTKLKYRPVVVIWNDAWEEMNDATPESIKHEPKVQVTVGFLIKKDKRGVTLATEYADDGTGLRTTNFIPKGMIVSVIHLSKSKSRKRS